jgi:hypothetical protein
MLNDHRYFMLLGALSIKSERIYPEEVYPFEYEGIELFAHKYKKAWGVTEFKTGCAMGHGKDREEAEQDAIAGINTIGVRNIKNSIVLTLSIIFEGFEYDVSKHDWVKREKVIQDAQMD